MQQENITDKKPLYDILSVIKADAQKAEQQFKDNKELKKAKYLRADSCRQVLSALTDQLKQVDFREWANLDNGDKITCKIYIVGTIDEIIKAATVNNWGLGIKNGFTYLFNGKYWQPLDLDTLKLFLANAAQKLGVPNIEANYHRFRDELYKQFSAVLNIDTPEQPKGVTLINLQNGTFEISDEGQKLREYRREDFLKYQLPFEYDPEAKAPIFDRYLKRVLPDENCRKVLAEYIGYIFTSGLKLEKVAILYGGGSNGKSVFFDIIKALIGKDNICSYSLQSLTKNDSYERADLANKLLNYASEINGKLEAHIFKQLASGEPVQARQIYGQPFTMENYAKLMFNCNELPKDVENTEAFFRRFLIIPSTQTISKEEADPELSQKIISSELSGVFNWMLDGLRRLLSQKRFSDAELIDAQLAEYRKESDSVLMFIEDEGYIKDTNKSVLVKTLYNEYIMYCTNNGYTHCSNKTLLKRLRGNGYFTQKTMYGQVVYMTKV